jgi:hypothetical protein
MTQPSLPTLPAIHGYWNVKPSAQGDKTQRKLLHAIGAALITWEGFESRLAELFTIFTQCPTDAAARAYGTIITNRGRCDMLIAAAEIYFHVTKADKATAGFFALLMRHCVNNASPIRNKIAHGISVNLRWGQRKVLRSGGFGKREKRGSYGFFLIPASYNTNKRPAFIEYDRDQGHFSFLRVQYRYTSADVLAFGAKFEILNHATKHFCEYLDPQNKFRRPNG